MKTKDQSLHMAAAERVGASIRAAARGFLCFLLCSVCSIVSSAEPMRSILVTSGTNVDRKVFGAALSREL